MVMREPWSSWPHRRRETLDLGGVVGRIVAPGPTIVPGFARRKTRKKPDQADEGLRRVEHLLDRAVVLVDDGLAGFGEGTVSLSRRAPGVDRAAGRVPLLTGSFLAKTYQAF